MKFTEEDILKGMECCTQNGHTCGACPFQEEKHVHGDSVKDIDAMDNGQRYDEKDCVTWLTQYAHELLLQKNEELQKKNDMLRKTTNANRRLLRDKYSSFWEKMKNGRK